MSDPTAATYTTLISTDDLARHPGGPDLVVVDCRFDLVDVAWGEADYAAGHIARAVYAHLERDLSGACIGTNGRHPLPPREHLVQRFGAWGIGDGVQVVACDQGPGMYASRLWWMLRYLGHAAVAVLDGGMGKWRREQRPVTVGVETGRPRTFVAAPRSELLVTADDVMRALSDPAQRLIDARAPERFEGRVEPLDPVAGHIPGAVNRCFQENLTADGTFETPQVLRRLWLDRLAGTPAASSIAYCGSGVTACHNVLALEHAGLAGARLYAGSWSEWCADPARPVATGPK